MLFNFFNSKTVIADTYIQDPVSTLKLYPVKSPAIRPTIIQTGAKISKTVLANAKKCVFVFHQKLADLVAGYLGFAKENLTAVGGDYYTFGLYLNSGKTQYLFYYGASATAVMNVSALTDDSYYKVTAIWNGTNHSFSFQKVSRIDNAITIGTAINSTVGTSGGNIADIDLGILAANYSNGSVGNGSKAKICCMEFFDENDNCIVHIPFSEGTGNLITDVCNGTTYTVINETDLTTFRNYTQDFSFYNFRYGFTLYQKDGSPDLRIPNKEDGTEITITPPSGYTRIANYKECQKTFNNCENLFKLDDVSAGSKKLTVWFSQDFYAGLFLENVDFAESGLYNGRMSYTSSLGDLIRWESTYWAIRNHLALGTLNNYSYSDVVTPDLATGWTQRGGDTKIDINLVTATSPSDLYTADIDHFLFTENTGVAKEIDVAALKTDLGFNRGYQYYNKYNLDKFMLYKTDKLLLDDVKVIKYIGMSDKIYKINGVIQYIDSHCVLTDGALS